MTTSRKLYKLAKVNGELCHVWFQASITQNNRQAIEIVEKDLLTKGWQPAEKPERSIKQVRKEVRHG